MRVLRAGALEPTLILCGATACGKSRLAVELAQRFGAEIVGADSRQVYRDMPIGTAAPSAEELASVPHHLVSFLDPRERYSAARFVIDAIGAIQVIHARGKRVIVVGGTGFYIRALCGDVVLAPEHDDDLRIRLARESQLHDAGFLYDWLRLRDSQRAHALEPNDRYRVLRALEISLAGEGRLREEPLPSLASSGIRFAKLVLDVPLATIDARIEERITAMLRDGLLDEAERIGDAVPAANAVGYPQAFAYLRGESTHEELRATLMRATRRYARRQQAWFRAEPLALWVAPSDVTGAAQELLGWL